MAIGYDLLIYRDFSDTFDTEIQVGDSARVLGFEDLHVVALGPPIHEGKAARHLLEALELERRRLWSSTRHCARKSSKAGTFTSTGENLPLFNVRPRTTAPRLSLRQRLREATPGEGAVRLAELERRPGRTTDA